MSLHFSRNLFFGAALSTSLLFVLASCQDEDFGYSSEYIQYAKNFTEFYGSIPADKSWDLSSYASTSNPAQNAKTRSMTNPTQLTSGTHYSVQNEYWQVPDKLLNWMKGHLIEGNDNRHLGSNFFLQLPDNDFAIIPIFQGNSAIMSQLEVKINDYLITPVWTKSDNMQVKDADDQAWQNLGYFDGQSHWTSFVPGTSYAPYPMHAASTLEVSKIQSKPIVFYHNQIVDNESTSAPYMYLSLFNNAKLLQGVAKKDGNGNPIKNSNDEIEYDYDEVNGDKVYKTTMWDEGNVWTTIGDRLTSINPAGYMLALDLPWNVKLNANELPAISNVTGAPSEAILVACEDANGTDSDHDINDVVFLIVGYPKAPTIVSTTKTIKKRYLCEDLGATEDFDFNDIVVDVTQTTTHTMKPTISADQFFNTGAEINNNSSVEIDGLSDAITTRQVARISHLCGTLPITAKVGTYLFPWITDPTDIEGTREQLSGTRAQYDVLEEGWNPNQEKVITDNSWDPETNNITIYVKWPDDWKVKPANSLDNVYVLNNHSNPFPHNSTDFADFANGKIAAATFPQNGNVPYIIAVNQDVHWMKECQNIPRDWLEKGQFNPSHEGVAGVGSGVFYENWGESNSEAHVWQGSVNGVTYSTGVQFAKGTNMFSDLKEALDLGYNVLHIYYEPLANAEIGLASMEGGWNLLTDKDADGYKPQTDAVVRDGYSCITVALTPQQIASIQNKGLVVPLRTDKLKVREITLTKENSFNVTLAIPSNGKVTTEKRVRWRSGAEAAKGRVPFESANFTQAVSLSATADEGYKFVGWYSNNQQVSTDNPYSVSSNCSLTAMFEQKQKYKVHAFCSEQGIGNITITSPTDMYDGNGTNIGKNATGRDVWVTEGTKITLVAPENQDYKFNGWSSGDQGYERTLTVSADSYPEAKYTAKLDAKLQLSVSEATITYPVETAGITWTSESPAVIKYKGYDWQEDVNIWTWGDEGKNITIHSQNRDLNRKEIIFYQEATEEYKSAEVKFYITVHTENGLIAELVNNCWTTVPDKSVNDWISIPSKFPTEPMGTVYGIAVNTEGVGVYDDLRSPVRYLMVNVAADNEAPRFFFNYIDKSGSDGFVVSVNTNSEYLLKKIEDDGTTSYYVKVEEIRKAKGNAYLNAIKSSAYNTTITVNAIKLGIPN